MVPVLDQNKIPLMPCTEKRARLLQERGQAKAYWVNGIFSIILQKEPSERNFQKIVLGIDPGSKREGYTVCTEKSVVLNITTDTPDWVKDKIETRKIMRKHRRYRKTPYRKCRWNRSKKSFLAPSTKARWNAKLRISNCLLKLIPITNINVEDICAVSKPGKKKWNLSFSPLETGKKYFYSELLKLNIILNTTKGYDTKTHRDLRGFKKISNKLSDVWEAHCVDSHSLCEIVLGRDVKINKKMYNVRFFNFPRRQLHVMVPGKGGLRKRYGGTVSMGIPKGTLVRHKKHKNVYVSGYGKDGISLYSVETGKRLTQCAKIEDIKIIKKLNWRTYLI